METMELVKLLVPVIILQFGLIIYALVDLKKNGVRNLSIPVWIIIIIALNTFGPILYLIFGRGDGYHVED